MLPDGFNPEKLMDIIRKYGFQEVMYVILSEMLPIIEFEKEQVDAAEMFLHGPVKQSLYVNKMMEYAAIMLLHTIANFKDELMGEDNTDTPYAIVREFCADHNINVIDYFGPIRAGNTAYRILLEFPDSIITAKFARLVLLDESRDTMDQRYELIHKNIQTFRSVAANDHVLSEKLRHTLVDVLRWEQEQREQREQEQREQEQREQREQEQRERME